MKYLILILALSGCAVAPTAPVQLTGRQKAEAICQREMSDSYTVGRTANEARQVFYSCMSRINYGRDQ